VLNKRKQKKTATTTPDKKTM